MAQENVERYRQLIEAFNRRDLAAVLTFIDPDADFAPRSVQLDGGAYRGHDGIRTWWEGMFTAFSDYAVTIEEARDLGDVTFGRTRMRGHGKESGAPVEEPQWHVIEWRAGKVISWQTFRTEAEALAAAGLS